MPASGLHRVAQHGDLDWLHPEQLGQLRHSKCTDHLTIFVGTTSPNLCICSSAWGPATAAARGGPGTSIAFQYFRSNFNFSPSSSSSVLSVLTGDFFHRDYLCDQIWIIDEKNIVVIWRNCFPYFEGIISFPILLSHSGLKWKPFLPKRSFLQYLEKWHFEVEDNRLHNY